MKPVLFSFAHPPQGCADMKEAVEKYADKMILMGHHRSRLVHDRDS